MATNSSSLDNKVVFLWRRCTTSSFFCGKLAPSPKTDGSVGPTTLVVLAVVLLSLGRTRAPVLPCVVLELLVVQTTPTSSVHVSFVLLVSHKNIRRKPSGIRVILYLADVVEQLRQMTVEHGGARSESFDGNLYRRMLRSFVASPLLQYIHVMLAVAAQTRIYVGPDGVVQEVCY